MKGIAEQSSGELSRAGKGADEYPDISNGVGTSTDRMDPGIYLSIYLSEYSIN